jgi:hypothetical protein
MRRLLNRDAARLLRFLAAPDLLAAVIIASCAAATAAVPDRLEPGLAWVFFDDSNFRRPRNVGTDSEVNFDTGNRINDYSKLWLGFVKAPVTGEITFSAEAEDGLRLHLAERLVIDGWGSGQAREGRLQMKAGESVPLRLEFFQSGGNAHLQLHWSWAGQPRQIIPASAFWHSAENVKQVRAFHTVRTLTPRLDKSAIYAPSLAKSGAPIHLRPGPHLFLDEFLIESSSNVVRRVNHPQRDPAIPNPIVTGREDGCFQPYMTVLRDEATGRFRLWYGVHTQDFNPGRSRLGYLESDDGVHWLRPHRVLDDPGPIQFGVSVLDEGAGFAPSSQRFKYAWYHATGLKIAVSPNGLNWTPLTPTVVLPHSHDINGLFWDPLRRRYVATVSFAMPGPTWSGSRRVTAQSASTNLLAWTEPWLVLTPDDRRDEGETQFYAMDGYLARGDLIIGMVKVLRDDLKADNPPVPPGAAGVGYTTLAWTRDGEHWTRDQAEFLERNPQPGAWDHAHAWIDEQLPVGEEVFLYYAGYKSGHKVNRFEERRIGLLKMKRDRYVAREAAEGSLRTPLLLLHGSRLTLNVEAPSGEVRVQVRDESERVIPGFAFADCQTVTGDGLALPVRWRRSPAEVNAKPVRLEFSLRNARLFAFDFGE